MKKRLNASLSSLFVAMTVLTLSAGAGEYYLNPAGGNMANPGTEASPWPSLETVAASGRTFAAGDVLILLAGHHGSPRLANANAGTVTVRPKTGARATLRRLSFASAARFWHVRDLEISPETSSSYGKVTLVDMAAASDCIVEGCYGYSVQNSSGWSAGDWTTLPCDALNASGSRNIIRRNTFRNVYWGIQLWGDNNLIQRNTVDRFAGDGLRGNGNYLTFEYNLVKNHFSVDDNHADGFQAWTTGPGGVGTGVLRGNVLRGNVIIEYDDPSLPFRGYLEGIGCFDGTYEDWVVENNVVIVDHWHGISLYGARNCKFLNNTVVDINRTGAGPAWLGVFAHKDGTPSTGNLVRNNLVSDLSISGTGNTVDYNLKTTAYETHFVDWAKVDLRLRAGSSAIDAGSSSQVPATDALEVTRPVDGNNDGTAAWDLGAYEYGAGSANQPPTIESEAWATPNPVTLPNEVTLGVQASDPEGDPLSYAWSKVSGPGTATFAAPTAADSGVAFSLAGIYTLRVTVSDGKGGSVNSEVTVTADPSNLMSADVNHDGVVNALDLAIIVGNFGRTTSDPSCDPRADANDDGVVNAIDLAIVVANFGRTVPVNQAPSANAQSVSATAGTAKTITLTGSDQEGSALTYTVVTQPAHGTLAGTAPNLTYTATAGYSGPDSFTFKVNDGASDSAPATVSITVTVGDERPTRSNTGPRTTELVNMTPLEALNSYGTTVSGKRITGSLRFSAPTYWQHIGPDPRGRIYTFVDCEIQGEVGIYTATDHESGKGTLTPDALMVTLNMSYCRAAGGLSFAAGYKGTIDHCSFNDKSRWAVNDTYNPGAAAPGRTFHVMQNCYFWAPYQTQPSHYEVMQNFTKVAGLRVINCTFEQQGGPLANTGITGIINGAFAPDNVLDHCYFLWDGAAAAYYSVYAAGNGTFQNCFIEDGTAYLYPDSQCTFTNCRSFTTGNLLTLP